VIHTPQPLVNLQGPGFSENLNEPLATTVIVGETVNPFPFIVGRSRSGTTLIRAALDSHSELAIPQESHFIAKLGRQHRRYESHDGFATRLFIQDIADDFAFKRWDIPPDKVTRSFAERPVTSFRDAIRRIYAINAELQGKSRFGDKTPGYVMHIPLIATIFPESRFIHVIRDGRNVALSHLAAGWGPKTIAEAAVLWKRFVERGIRAGVQLGPERYFEVRYEDFVNDPETHTRDLCRYLDLTFEPEMLRYSERAEAIIGNVNTLLRRGHQNLHLPPTKGLRDWRKEMTRGQVVTFEAIAGDLLQSLDYERAAEHLSVSERLDAKRRWVGVQALRASRRARKLVSANQ
jgi:hypothetical protein